VTSSRESDGCTLWMARSHSSEDDATKAIFRYGTCGLAFEP
jgi:hypothetical protein